MIYEIIITSLLVAISAVLFVSPFSRMMPAPMKIMPLIALAVFWLQVLLFKLPGKGGCVNVLLLILFYFLFVIIVLPAGVGSLVFSGFDKERFAGPVTLDNDTAKKTVYLVYHPGGSDFPKNAVESLARDFQKTGYRIVMYTANSKLHLDLKKAAGLVVSSPVYGGQVRPALLAFLEQADLKGVRCSIMLTGGGPASSEGLEYKSLEKLITEKGGTVTGRTKIFRSKDDKETQERIADAAAALLKTLE